MLSAAPATHAGGIEPVQNFTMQLVGERAKNASSAARDRFQQN